MDRPTIDFTVAEKLAIVQAVESVILVDGTVHNGEINALGRLMKRIDFDSGFIAQARNITPEQGLSILRDLPRDKKNTLVKILEEIAISDGFVHEKETALMSTIFSFIGIEQKTRTTS